MQYFVNSCLCFLFFLLNLYSFLIYLCSASFFPLSFSCLSLPPPYLLLFSFFSYQFFFFFFSIFPPILTPSPLCFHLFSFFSLAFLFFFFFCIFPSSSFLFLFLFLLYFIFSSIFPFPFFPSYFLWYFSLSSPLPVDIFLGSDRRLKRTPTTRLRSSLRIKPAAATIASWTPGTS